MDFVLPTADTLSTELVPVQTTYLHGVIAGILKKLEFQDKEIKRLNVSSDRIEGLERDVTALQEGMLGLEEAMRKREMDGEIYCTKSAARTMVDSERQLTDKDLEKLEARIRETEYKLNEPDPNTQAIADMYSLFDLKTDAARSVAQSQSSVKVRVVHELPPFSQLADSFQSQIDALNDSLAACERLANANSHPKTPPPTVYRPTSSSGHSNHDLSNSGHHSGGNNNNNNSSNNNSNNVLLGRIGSLENQVDELRTSIQNGNGGMRSNIHGSGSADSDSGDRKRVQFEDKSDEEREPTVTITDLNNVKSRVSGLEGEARSLQQQLQLQKQNRFPYTEVSERLQTLEDQYNRLERLKANRSELHKVNRHAAEVEHHHHRTNVNISEDGTGLLRYKCLSCKGPADKHEELLVPGPSKVFPPGTVLVSSPTSKAYLEWSSRVPSPSRRPKTADSRQSEVVQVVVKEGTVSTSGGSTPSPPKNGKQVRTRILGSDKKIYQGSLGDAAEVAEMMRPATAPSPYPGQAVPQPQ